MALSQAIQFVKQIRSDADFFASCNKIKSKTDLMAEMGFSETEFDDAINMQLVKCQTYDEAEHFQQIRLWFTIF